MAAQRPNSAAPAAKAAGEESFENLLARLEQIVAQLEAGERPLEESLALYEQGVSTLKRCHVILDGADKRIRRLVETSAGEAVLQDITQATKASNESRKSKARGAAPPQNISAQDSGQDFEAADEAAAQGPGSEESENSGEPDIDSEPESPHNPPSSISKAKTKSPQTGLAETKSPPRGKAGGSLFGSAQ